MKLFNSSLIIVCTLMLNHSISSAQDNNNLPDKQKKEKKFSFKLGAGLYQPILNEEGVTFTSGTNNEGVTFSGATYDPKIKTGFNFNVSLDYAVSDKFYIGLGFNGGLAKAQFIRDAVVNNQEINGYLEEGALENILILLNFTYSPKGKGIKPFAKLGIGYIAQEIELGDVPISLTNNVETEIFTDYKNKGIGFLPEIGIRYNKFFLSLAYSFSLNKLEGEEVDGFISSGEVSAQGLQFNLAYNLFTF